MAKERIGLDAIKNAATRKIVETELSKLKTLKFQAESITNRDHTGTFDILKKTVEARFVKLGIDTQNLVYDGMSYAVQPGTSVTCSKESLKKALMAYDVDIDAQEGILNEAFTVSKYTSLVVKQDTGGK